VVIPSEAVVAEQTHRPFRGPIAVGEPVGVNLGVQVVRGRIVEDRGDVGARGRRLVRVEVPIGGTTEVRSFEVPVDELLEAPPVS
jgi:hypothetical protein